MNKMLYTLARGFFKTIGRSSQGIYLCFEEGLTSGKTVDYVYNNKAHGSFLIGKLIDRQFLNHPGWEGVRQRRKNLEALIFKAIQELRMQGKSIFMLDIASGPAAYILSVLANVGEHDITTVCRDLDDRWLVEGRQAAKAKNLKKIRFEKGDALDASSLNFDPKPNLIVASGFYDWIVDDDTVKSSFSAIYKNLDDQGFFVITNQMAHPNLEFVEQVFTDFNHEPLRMTMRSEAKIQKWLTDAGFTVDTTLKDLKGYYSVTKARKN